MDAIFSNNEVVLQNITYPSDYTELSEAINSTAWISLLRLGVVFFPFFLINFLVFKQTQIAKFGNENANEMKSIWVLQKCFLMYLLAKT